MKKLEKILAENMRRFGTKNLSEASMNADSDQPTNSPIYRLYNSLVNDLGFKLESGTLQGSGDHRGITNVKYVKYIARPKPNARNYSPLKLTFNATIDKDKNTGKSNEFDEIFYTIVASTKFGGGGMWGWEQPTEVEESSMERTYDGNGIHMTTQNLKTTIANFVKYKFGKVGFIYK